MPKWVAPHQSRCVRVCQRPHGEKLIFLKFLGSSTQIEGGQNTISTGLSGSNCVRPKKMVVWGSRRLRSLMMLCEVNKYGAWCIIRIHYVIRFLKQDSILATLFAKESTLGSYAWKSILSVKDVIKKGMVWQVGNEKSVCIKEDKWRPDKICRIVIAPPPSLPPDAKVSSLIDAESATWKVDQV